jgi:hypothetical protein
LRERLIDGDAFGCKIGEAVKSTVPQEMWGEIVEKLEELEQHSGSAAKRAGFAWTIPLHECMNWLAMTLRSDLFGQPMVVDGSARLNSSTNAVSAPSHQPWFTGNDVN